MISQLFSRSIRAIRISTLVCAAAILTSCEKTPKPSPIFKTQIIKILELGTKINANISQGVNYTNFNSALNDLSGAVELSMAMWPENFAVNSKSYLKEAVDAWKFSSDVWRDKIKYGADLGTPYQVSNYESMSDEFKSTVRLEYSTSFKQKYFSYDELPTCLSYGSAKFEAARKEILAELK